VDELLPRLPQGRVLVLDNARIHKSHSLREAVELEGHQLLFLPTYSPDFNPIELVWSWLKNWVRHFAPEGDEQRKQAIFSSSEHHHERRKARTNSNHWILSGFPVDVKKGRRHIEGDAKTLVTLVLRPRSGNLFYRAGPEFDLYHRLVDWRPNHLTLLLSAKRYP